MSETTSPAKRRLSSSLGAGGGVLGVSTLIPATRVKPIIDAVILPTHAQMSPGSGNEGENPAPEEEVRGVPTDGTAAFVPGQTDERRGVPPSVTATLSGTSGVRVTRVAAPVGVDRYDLSYRRSGEQDFRTGDANTETVAADAVSLRHAFTFPQGEDPLLPGDTFMVDVTAMYDTNGTQAASEQAGSVLQIRLWPLLLRPHERITTLRAYQQP